MVKHLLPAEGSFYKANLHTHTTVSDGKLTPAEAKAWFVEHGYSVVAFTDHEVMVPHPELCDEGFVAITSYEMSVSDSSWNPYTKTYHMNVYSPDVNMSAPATFWRVAASGRESMRSHITPEMIERGVTEPRKYTKEYVQWMIDASVAEGCLVSYNHPVWSLQDKDDYSGLKGFFGVEWYNNSAARTGYVDTVQPIVDLLAEGERMCYPLATDDCHGSSGYGGGWVQIKAPVLEYSAIFNALRAGDFYSSTGPEIYSLYVEEGEVVVTSSAAVRISFVTDHRHCASKHGSAEAPICEARFSLEKLEANRSATPEGRCAWFRIDVTDAAGHVARTRSYFADEIF